MLAGAAIVCLVGWVAVNRLVIDAFPDTMPVPVQINTVAAGMVAEEIERQITFIVELAMGGMPGLESIRSASMFGLSVVIVTFTIIMTALVASLGFIPMALSEGTGADV